MAEDNIVQLEVTVTLPDAVAREAEARGVLTAQTLETLIKAKSNVVALSNSLQQQTDSQHFQLPR